MSGDQEEDDAIVISCDELRSIFITSSTQLIANVFADLCVQLGCTVEREKLKKSFMMDVFMKIRSQPGVKFQYALYIMQEELKLIDVEENLYEDEDEDEAKDESHLVNIDTK